MKGRKNFLILSRMVGRKKKKRQKEDIEKKRK